MKIPKEITDEYFQHNKYPPMDTGSDEWWAIKCDFELKDSAFAGMIAYEDYGKPLGIDKIKKLKSGLEEFKNKLDDYKPKDELELGEKELLQSKVNAGLEIYGLIINKRKK